MVRYGVVGSRKRKDRHNVIKLIDSFDVTDEVISGGCNGVDTWAETRAKKRGMQTIICKPDLSQIKGKTDMIRRYHERNRRIAKLCDVLFAFVSKDRRGGTENTILHAKEFGKQIIIIPPENDSTILTK